VQMVWPAIVMSYSNKTDRKDIEYSQRYQAKNRK